MPRGLSVKVLLVVLIFLICVLLFNQSPPPACPTRAVTGDGGNSGGRYVAGGLQVPGPFESEVPERPHSATLTKRGNATYTRDSTVIFVGGMPRSGTTLMRVILDAHSRVLCGEETRVVPRILQMRQQWVKSNIEKERLQKAGMSPDVLDSATAAFILEILAKHASTAPDAVLCDKDPFNLKSMMYLSGLFPQSRFLLMIRDGRATAHSIITRKVTISGFDITSYRDVLTKWNKAIKEMWSQCNQLGRTRCLPVWYEQLVLQPNKTVREITSFLGIGWQETMLHHQDLVGKNISVSVLERSTDQVAKPVNLDGLYAWFGHLPASVEREMASIAPMLSTLGYDPYSSKPSYGEPDALVLANLKLMDEHPERYKAESYRIDRQGKMEQGQPGAIEMEQRRRANRYRRNVSNRDPL